MKALDSFNSHSQENPDPKQEPILTFKNHIKSIPFTLLQKAVGRLGTLKGARVQCIGATVENVSWFPSPKWLETKATPP